MGVEEEDKPASDTLVVINESDADRGISERPNQGVRSSSFGQHEDLSTGRMTEETERGIMAFAMSTRDAMGFGARNRKSMKKVMSQLRKRRSKKWRNSLEVDDSLSTSMHGRLTVHALRMNDSRVGGDEETGCEKSKQMQYRLSARVPRTGKWYRFLRKVGVTVGTAAIYEDTGDENNGCLCFGFSFNYLVTRFINFLFRASFLRVLFTGALGFYILTLFFALLIFASGINHPDCVHVNGQTFGQSGAGNRFSDAYELSWTTFSTVVRHVVNDLHGMEGSNSNGSLLISTSGFWIGFPFHIRYGRFALSKMCRNTDTLHFRVIRRRVVCKFLWGHRIWEGRSH